MTHERHENDLYITPSWVAELAVKLALDYYPGLPHTVFEPGAGPTAPFLHAMARQAASPAWLSPLTLVGMDIEDYGIPQWAREPSQDFVYLHGQGDYNDLDYGCDSHSDMVLFNPPFKHAEAFIHRAMYETVKVGSVMVVLLRLSMLAGQNRYRTLWLPEDAHPFKLQHVKVLAKRPSFTEDKGTDAKTDYALFVWTRGGSDAGPTIGWYHPEDNR